MYKMLLQTPSSTKSPNWTRSRIRRQHLIALGIPVNLDEVLPKAANGRSMPILEVRTRPMSAPPERGFKGSAVAMTGAGSNHPSRSGTPQPQGGPQSNLVAQFGPKPGLDRAKINKLLELDAGTLLGDIISLISLIVRCRISDDATAPQSRTAAK